MAKAAGGRTSGWKAARWARRAVQILSFAAFVYLLFAALQRLEPQPLANIFFRFDPLAALTTMLAARDWLVSGGEKDVAFSSSSERRWARSATTVPFSRTASSAVAMLP